MGNEVEHFCKICKNYKYAQFIWIKQIWHFLVAVIFSEAQHVQLELGNFCIMQIPQPNICTADPCWLFSFFSFDIKSGHRVYMCVDIWKLAFPFTKFNLTSLVAVIFSTHLKMGNFCTMQITQPNIWTAYPRWLFCHWYKSWIVCVNISTTFIFHSLNSIWFVLLCMPIFWQLSCPIHWIQIDFYSCCDLLIWQFLHNKINLATNICSADPSRWLLCQMLHELVSNCQRVILSCFESCIIKVIKVL